VLVVGQPLEELPPARYESGRRGEGPSAIWDTIPTTQGALNMGARHRFIDVAFALAVPKEENALRAAPQLVLLRVPPDLKRTALEKVIEGAIAPPPMHHRRHRDARRDNCCRDSRCPSFGPPRHLHELSLYVFFFFYSKGT
jgi:hypothetical protein